MSPSEAVQVAMTAEPSPPGYGQHMLTVERGNADSVQCMILTDLELMQLECLIANYRASGRIRVHADFGDRPGRPVVVHEEQRETARLVADELSDAGDDGERDGRRD